MSGMEKPVEIAGHSILMREPTPDQLALLAREMRALKSYTGGDENAMIARVARAYNILESMAVLPEDRDKLSDLVSTRELSLSHMVDALRQLAAEGEDATPKKSTANPRRSRAS